MSRKRAKIDVHNFQLKYENFHFFIICSSVRLICVDEHCNP